MTAARFRDPVGTPDLSYMASYVPCRDEDPELFFPPSYDTPWGLAQTERAKSVCRRCPGREGCLAHTLLLEAGKHDRFGVRGGTTPDERAPAGAEVARRIADDLDADIPDGPVQLALALSAPDGGLPQAVDQETRRELVAMGWAAAPVAHPAHGVRLTRRGRGVAAREKARQS